MGPKYTTQMHEEYRRKVDEKADKEAEELRERIEKETTRRAWLAEAVATLQGNGTKPTVSAKAS